MWSASKDMILVTACNCKGTRGAANLMKINAMSTTKKRKNKQKPVWLRIS